MTSIAKIFGLEGNEAQTSGLQELFINELKDIYWAEQELVDSLQKLADSATTDELKIAFGNHLEETKLHVIRLKRVFEIIGVPDETEKCEAMAGLIDEADDLIDDTESDTLVRDVALISAAQKVEHYEIATYGTLRTLAEVLGYSDVAELLDQTLEEEKNADSMLTEIATGWLNNSARSE